MSWRVCCLLLLVRAGFGQTDAPPQFELHGIPIAPGLIGSLYGQHFGPSYPCFGKVEPDRHETPSPLRPVQTATETSIYPTELCGVQVFIGGLPAELLYVSGGQINFKTPQETLMSGETEVRVVYQGQSSTAATSPLGFGTAAVSLAGPAKVGMPVWLKVSIPPYYGGDHVIRYPLDVLPANFKCHEIEVRRDGKLLTPIASGYSQAFGGITGNGPPCGSVAPASTQAHVSQLPLHLQYRFDQPGIYEVRYSMHNQWPTQEIKLQTEWTRIEILPASPHDRHNWLAEMKAHAPTDAAALVDDFLPSILGVRDAESLEIVSQYLFHPNNLVRQFAMYGLTYWPREQAEAVVRNLLRTKGASEAAARFLSGGAATTVDREAVLAAAIPGLQSGDPAQLLAAVESIRQLPRGSATNALIAAADRVLDVADARTSNEYCSVLGGLSDARVRPILWRFVDRNVAREQAAIALSWQHAAADLPRLAEIAMQQDGFAGLPYALRSGYGDAAIPYLETILKTSKSIPVQTQSARELMLAGKQPGFAYALDAIENGSRSRGELFQFVRDSFPGMRQADEAAIVSFLRTKAK